MVSSSAFIRRQQALCTSTLRRVSSAAHPCELPYTTLSLFSHCTQCLEGNTWGRLFAKASSREITVTVSFPPSTSCATCQQFLSPTVPRPASYAFVQYRKGYSSPKRTRRPLPLSQVRVVLSYISSSLFRDDSMTSGPRDYVSQFVRIIPRNIMSNDSDFAHASGSVPKMTRGSRYWELGPKIKILVLLKLRLAKNLRTP